MPKIKEVIADVKEFLHDLFADVEKETVEFFQAVIVQVEENGGPKLIAIVKEELEKLLKDNDDLGKAISDAAKNVVSRVEDEGGTVLKNAVYAALAAEVANLPEPEKNKE